MAKFKLSILGDFSMIAIYHLSFLVVLAALYKFHFHKATHTNTYLSLNLETKK